MDQTTLAPPCGRATLLFEQAKLSALRTIGSYHTSYKRAIWFWALLDGSPAGLKSTAYNLASEKLEDLKKRREREEEERKCKEELERKKQLEKERIRYEKAHQELEDLKLRRDQEEKELKYKDEQERKKRLDIERERYKKAQQELKAVDAQARRRLEKEKLAGQVLEDREHLGQGQQDAADYAQGVLEREEQERQRQAAQAQEEYARRGWDRIADRTRIEFEDAEYQRLKHEHVHGGPREPRQRAHRHIQVHRLSGSQERTAHKSSEHERKRQLPRDDEQTGHGDEASENWAYEHRVGGSPPRRPRTPPPARPPSPPPPGAIWIQLPQNPDPHHGSRKIYPRVVLVRQLLEFFYQNGHGRNVMRRNAARNRFLRSFQVSDVDVRWDGAGGGGGGEDGRHYGGYGPRGRGASGSSGGCNCCGNCNCAQDCYCKEGYRKRGRIGEIIIIERSESVAKTELPHVRRRRSSRTNFQPSRSKHDESPWTTDHADDRGRHGDRGYDHAYKSPVTSPSSKHKTLWGGKPGGVWFFLMRDGHICTNHRPSSYKEGHWNKYLRDMLQNEYDSLRTRWRWRYRPFREIAFAYFHLWECINLAHDIWELTDSAPIVGSSKSSISAKPLTNHFRYLMRHPPEDRRWTIELDDKIKAGRGNGMDFVVMVEIIEGLNTRFIYILTAVNVLCGIIIGVVYSVVKKKVGDAFTIAGYWISAASFIIVVVATGEWFGMESPDCFSETDMADMDRVVGRLLFDEEEHKSHHEEPEDIV
ncbi:hypothetical protein BU26DRAFT_607168 [Trematosphaeria pertusa]|uniref:Uncharacterized protein n=1 Tax=Trematosphaeria pertusa TaxID=390896 RepID=A0A6A6I7D2_9PLEO|nr:uncharacterized protein BU26DRAFT_607168 [Trematosphaeria pertusa]KAF2245862.1 hypothetical protein BU26DRAFT_607168 [Trematosphaeria pertusa]